LVTNKNSNISEGIDALFAPSCQDFIKQADLKKESDFLDEHSRKLFWNFTPDEKDGTSPFFSERNTF
jgi:hypothetical protein